MATAAIPPPLPLTDRQRVILDLIRASIRERGFPPSIREMGAASGIRSPNGICCHLRALEKKGAIRRDWNRSRSIAVLEADPPAPSEAARLLRTLADRATRLPRGHDQTPCTHAIYLTPDELAAIERHAAPGEGGS